MAEVYLSLGSNLGDRIRYLKRAIEKIGEPDSVVIRKISPVYETDPVGNPDQSRFLNLVVSIETNLKPLRLLDYLLDIEKKLGRERNEKWGPRTIDLDILLYDELITISDRLTLPHPRMHQRRFVLVPLAQINPNLFHPSLKKSVEELLRSCPDQSEVELSAEKI
ncbi:MAG: 2-amino-4-hydroxy-6-hydroxymethyldihydropteridine diphosphokinase [Candidatus Zixiibacteriota bacterium]